MQFVQRLQQAHVLAAGLCKSSDDIVADSLANCVAANELQVTLPRFTHHAQAQSRAVSFQCHQPLNACRPPLPSTL